MDFALKVLNREHDGQFLQLVRHFFNGFFANDLVSTKSETGLALTHILALLAVPGAFISLRLLPKYSFYLARLPLAAQDLASLVDKCFFLALSMVITGFITVLEWDTLFPDRRDYRILTPLPIHLRTLFLAKGTALALFLIVFSIAINGFSTVLFPIVMDANKGALLNNKWFVMSPTELEVIRERVSVHHITWFVVTHALSVFAGNAFVFLSCISIQGLLMNVLGFRTFRVISRLVQVVLMILLLSVFFLFPEILASFDKLKLTASFNTFFPPMWFLGLYETMLGTTDRALKSLAAIAVAATALAVTAFLMVYAVSYKRHYRRSLEGEIIATATLGELSRSVFRLLDRFVVRNPVEQASFSFVSKTIFRSNKHRLYWGAYLSVGLALVFVGLVTPVSPEYGTLARLDSALLSIPLVLSFFVLAGMRVIFTVPAELPSNWVFKLTENESRKKHFFATHKVMFYFGTLPLFVVLLPFYLFLWGWPTTLLHFSYGMTLSLILIEVLLLKFHKIPFTCSYLPGKANIKLLWSVYLFSFTTYAYTMTKLESWLLVNPVRFAYFYGAVLPLLIRWIIYRNRSFDRRLSLMFEEEPTPAVQTLDLSY
jgi:hypothetical protein